MCDFFKQCTNFDKNEKLTILNQFKIKEQSKIEKKEKEKNKNKNKNKREIKTKQNENLKKFEKLNNLEIYHTYGYQACQYMIEV